MVTSGPGDSLDHSVHVIPPSKLKLPTLTSLSLAPVWFIGAFVEKPSSFTWSTIPDSRRFKLHSTLLQLPQDEAILFDTTICYENETELHLSPAAVTPEPTYSENSISCWIFSDHSWIQSSFLICHILFPDFNTEQALFFITLDQIIHTALKLDAVVYPDTPCRYSLEISDPLMLKEHFFETFIEDILTSPSITKIFFRIQAFGQRALLALRWEAEDLVQETSHSERRSDEDVLRLRIFLFSDILSVGKLTSVNRKIESLKQIKSSFPTVDELNSFDLLDGVNCHNLAENQILPMSSYYPELI
ncbi:hypothetical protein HDE_00922 [Halotydeus destructor]|nr:hypothetical protein HDE_00922 [Halotydeus destructor]